MCVCIVATIYNKCSHAENAATTTVITGIKVMCGVLGATTMLTKPPLRRFWHTNLNLKQSNAMKKHKPSEKNIYKTTTTTVEAAATAAATENNAKL